MSIRPLRRAVQWAVLLTFAAVPLLNAAGHHFLSGNLLSFSFGSLPLADPLAVLQVWAGALSGTATMFLAAGLPLLAAALLGPVFCSWVCPYGLLSELVHGLRGQDRAKRRQSAGPFALRAGLVCAGLLAALCWLHMPLLNQLSMPGWCTRALQHALPAGEILWGALLVPAVLLAEAAAGRRLWCRYICPQSVLLALAGLILPARLRPRFSPGACLCGEARPCERACSLELNPRRDRAGQRLQCTNCGDCVDTCRERARALRFGFAREKDSS